AVVPDEVGARRLVLAGRGRAHRPPRRRRAGQRSRLGGAQLARARSAVRLGQVTEGGPSRVAIPARHVACRNEKVKRRGVRRNSGAGPLPPPRSGGEVPHVCNGEPVITDRIGTGDFEGCARPSQPTIGIAALEAVVCKVTRRGQPGGATRRAVTKTSDGEGI